MVADLRLPKTPKPQNPKTLNPKTLNPKALSGKDLYVLFDGFLCLYYETTTKTYIGLEGWFGFEATACVCGGMYSSQSSGASGPVSSRKALIATQRQRL